MALIYVVNTEGQEVLVHTSIFDHIGKRPATATGSWADVWAKADKRVTAEEIEAARTPAGGWTKAQLAAWGVPWPPPKGWKKALTEAPR